MKSLVLKFLLLIGIVLVVLACKNEQKTTDTPTGFVLKGTVTNLDNGKLILSFTKDKKRNNDTILVTKGSFSFEGKVDAPHKAYLEIVGVDQYAFPFFIENSVMSVKINKEDLENSIVSGSKSHTEYEKFKAHTSKSDNEELEGLYEAYENAKDDEAQGEIENKIMAISDRIDERIKKYINENGDSYVAADAVLRMYGYNPDADELQGVYDGLAEEIKMSEIGQNILDILEKAKLTSVGQKAMDIAMIDADGTTKTLSSLKGNYVLVDFWASWCGPCRAENPTVKKAYETYHDKGFEIYAVSIDTKKENWLKAIAEDGLPWIHVSNLERPNPAAEAYGIKGIPMNYLLDKEGVIVAKGLRGEDLMTELEKLVI